MSTLDSYFYNSLFQVFFPYTFQLYDLYLEGLLFGLNSFKYNLEIIILPKGTFKKTVTL